MSDALIRHYYDCFNRRRFGDAAELFAPDADVELIPGERGQGGAAYLRFAETWVAAFPDATMAIQRVEQRSETLAEVYLLATGTHEGPLRFGIYKFRPTLAEVVLHVRELLDIRHGDCLVGADRRPERSHEPTDERGLR